jgi:hypothetical protein
MLIHCTSNAVGVAWCWRSRKIDGIREIVVVERILVDRIAKELRPLGRMKVGQCVGDGRNGGEPIVEDNMKLGSDSPRGRVQDEWNGACMIGRESHVDGSMAARLPAR